MRSQSLVDTVLFHINALTGDNVREEGASTPRLALEGFDAVQGPLIDVYMLPGENRTIVILDEYLQVCWSPLCSSARLTVYRFAFIRKLHQPRLSSSPSPHPSTLLSVWVPLASARFWAINSPSTMSCPSSMLPIRHGRFCTSI